MTDVRIRDRILVLWSTVGEKIVSQRCLGLTWGVRRIRVCRKTKLLPRLLRANQTENLGQLCIGFSIGNLQFCVHRTPLPDNELTVSDRTSISCRTGLHELCMSRVEKPEHVKILVVLNLTESASSLPCRDMANRIKLFCPRRKIDLRPLPPAPLRSPPPPSIPLPPSTPHTTPLLPDTLGVLPKSFLFFV